MLTSLSPLLYGFCIQTAVACNHGVLSMTVTANPGAEVAKDFLLAPGRLQGTDRICPSCHMMRSL